MLPARVGQYVSMLSSNRLNRLPVRSSKSGFPWSGPGNDRELLRMATRMARIGGWAVELPALRVRWSDEVCAIHGVPPGFSPTVEEAIEFYAPESRPIITTLVE